jgi:hypothetical protein
MWDDYQNSTSQPSYTNVLQRDYDWFTTNSSATNDYLSKPWGVAEWGSDINDNPTVAEQTNSINGLNDALNTNNQFPKLKLLEYFDELSPALLPGSVSTYSNFANSPYMEQQCSP